MYVYIWYHFLQYNCLPFCFLLAKYNFRVETFKCISAPNVAVKVAVTKYSVAVKGPQVAVVLG